MDRRTTLTKTAKGLMEATGKTGFLSRDLRNVLKEIEGKIRVSTLVEKLDSIDEPDLMASLAKLEKDGFIQEFTPHEDAGPPTRPGVRSPTPPAPADDGEDLDFSSIPPSPPSKPTPEPRTGGRGVSPGPSSRAPQAPPSPPARPPAAKEPTDGVLGAEERIRAQLAAARAKREAGVMSVPTKAPEQVQVPKEVEDKIRRELEEKLRNEATQRRLREEEERQKREADEKARREKEEAARAERAKADDFAKLQASLTVKSDADERAEREAKERESREREANERESKVREKREAEERARRETEEKSRAAAEQRSRAEAEARRGKEEEERAKKARQKAREEAEARERAEAEERERQENEERASREAEEEARRWKEAEKKAKEEEKARARAEADAVAQARREDRERERLEREELKQAEAEEKARLKETAEREVSSSAVRGSSGRSSARAAPRSLGRPIAMILFLLLIGAVVALLFMPIDPAPYEKSAQEWFGQPVKIGSAGVSLTPSPALRFDNVVIGTGPQQLRIASLRAVPEPDSLLGDRMVLKRVEFDNATLPREFLGAVLSIKRPGGPLRIGRIVAKGLKLNVPGIALPPLDLEAVLGPEGDLKSATLSNSDLRLTVNLVPKGGKADIDITSAGSFSLPIGARVSLEGFSAKGSITPAELVLTDFNGGAFDGYLRGNARMRWSDGWSLDGEAAASQMDVAAIAPTMLSNGRVEGKGAYSMRAPTADKLFESLKLDGTFSIQKGSISALDMTRVMQGDRIGGGSTLFSEMTGGVVVDSGRIQLRQLHLVAGLLNASIALDVDPNKNLSGRLQAELRAQTTQAKTTLAIFGTLKSPQFRRGN